MTTRHSTKDKGDLALSKVIADLRQHGILVCLPLAEHLPFDLIAVMPDMTTLLRVQVKYRGGTKHGNVLVEFKNNYYNSHKIYSKPVDFSEIDAYAIYIPDVDQVCYFNVGMLRNNASSITLRFEPPKNNQRKGVHLVEDYTNPNLVACSNMKHVDLTPRHVSIEDEIAIEKFANYLQEQHIYPLYPRSLYSPFDLLGVTADTKTIKRYRIGYEHVEFTPYADYFVLYRGDDNEPIFVDAIDTEQDASIHKKSHIMP